MYGYTGMQNKKKTNEFIVLNKSELDEIQLMDKKYLYCWLTEKNILEVILGENIHEEILKRSLQVIKLYAEKGGLTNDIYDTILKLWSEKHESIAIYLEKMLCEIISVITEKVLYLLNLNRKPYIYFLVTS